MVVVTNGWWKTHICVWSLCSGCTDLLRLKGDPQAQLGHAVLLEQLEVWTQCQAEGSGYALQEPTVFRRITCASFWLRRPLQEEDLHQTRAKVNSKAGHRRASEPMGGRTSVQRMIFPFSLYSDF